MTSILTNNGAMVALQTLKSINNNLESTQNEIATGKKVASAKDNAAIWAVSKTMEEDVSSFKVINDSLGVAESTVATGLAGAERVVDILTQMKDLATGAMTDGTDFGKVQAQIAKKAEELTSVISGTQMNGINLLKTDIGNTGADFSVLASLDRTNGTAATAPNTITVTSVNFEGTIDPATIQAIGTTGEAATALGQIEGFLELAIQGAANLGAAAENISSQREFVGKLTTSLESGMGSLVDADMEEASARLKALQTQQQLGVQSLSIANQAPGAIMSLFR